MGYPVDERYGLTLAFADFHLLPELLARVPGGQGPGIPRSWSELPDGLEFNIEHWDDNGDRDEEEVRIELARDAWRLAIGLELVTDEGLTGKGRELARLAVESGTDRSGEDARFLSATLAEQIHECYLKESVSITRLLLEGAKRLADCQWAEYCPGLLLIEVQELIERSHTEPKRIVSWTHDPDELVAARTEAMRRYGNRSADLDVYEAMLDDPEYAAQLHDRVNHADAVTFFYFSDRKLNRMTITEVRSTAMLLTFAGLLDEQFPMGPVQCLTAPPEREADRDGA